jgi:hypothetical protein
MFTFCLRFINKMIAEVLIAGNQCAQHKRYLQEFYRPVKLTQHLKESPGKFRESTNSAKGRKFFNVLALGEEAEFEALNCQPSSKVDTRQNAQLTTEPPIS